MRNKYVVYSNKIQDIMERIMHSTYSERYSPMEKRVATILDEEGNACAKNKYFSLRKALDIFREEREISGCIVVDKEYYDLKALNKEASNYFYEILYEHIMKNYSLSISFVNMFIETLDKHEDLKEEFVNFILSLKALPNIPELFDEYAPDYKHLRSELYSLIDIFCLFMVVRKESDIVFEKGLGLAKDIKDKFYQMY